MSRRRVTRRALDAALELSRRFFGFDPRSVKKITMEVPKALVMLGTCAQVNYLCDKFDGRPREYWHKFEGAAILAATPDKMPNGSRMLVIIGNFEIDEDGIKG